MPGDFENIAVAVSKAMQTHIHNTKQHFKVVHVNCARCQFFELKSTIRENLQDEMQRNLIKIGIITKSTKAPNEPFYQKLFLSISHSFSVFQVLSFAANDNREKKLKEKIGRWNVRRFNSAEI